MLLLVVAWLGARVQAGDYYVRFGGVIRGWSYEVGKIETQEGAFHYPLWRDNWAYITDDQSLWETRAGESSIDRSASLGSDNLLHVLVDLSTGVVGIRAQAPPMLVALNEVVNFLDYRLGDVDRAKAEYADLLTFQGPFEESGPIPIRLRARVHGTVVPGSHPPGEDTGLASSLNFSVDADAGTEGGAVFSRTLLVMPGEGADGFEQEFEGDIWTDANGFQLRVVMDATCAASGQVSAQIDEMQIVIPPGFEFRSKSGRFLSEQPPIVGPKLIPTVQWATPAPITAGDPLSSAELHATASVAGHFVYQPPAGTLLNAGIGQPLSVTFIPHNSVTFDSVTISVLLDVLPTEEINHAPNAGSDAFATDEDTVLHIAIPDLLLNDTDEDGDSVSCVSSEVITLRGGSLTSNPEGTELLYTPPIDFHGSDEGYYWIGDGNGMQARGIIILRVDPVNDAPIVTGSIADSVGEYGRTFELQLGEDLFADPDGGSNVILTISRLPEGLDFNPVTRTIAGIPAQAGSFTVTLTATDDGQPPQQASVDFQISIAKGTPIINWPTPRDINCHMQLGPTQLNAVVDAVGTLTYQPPAGTNLPLGDGQVLTVSFTPADPANWNPVTASTMINVRLDAGLATVWERAISGVALVSLAPAPEHQVAAIGYSWIGGFDFFVGKFSSPDGRLIWQERFNTPGSSSYDQAKAGAVDVEGNVIATGYSFVDSGDQDYLTAKFAALDGSLLWVSRYDGPAGADDQASAVAADAEGNVYVTGHSWNGSNWDIHTLKYAAADGAVLWEQHYNDPSNGQDYGTAIGVDSEGDVVIAGSSGSDYYIAKYASRDGALRWQAVYDSGDDQVMSLAIDAEDHIVVTGFSSALGSGYDFCTLRYTSDGSLLWVRRHPSLENRNEYGGSVAADSFGNVLVAGHAENGTSSDYLLAKYTAQDGELIWEQRIANRLGFLEGATHLAADAAGNAVFSGLIRRVDDALDGYTASLSAAHGAIRWEYRAPTQGNTPRPMFVGDKGEVFTTGNATLLKFQYGTAPTMSLLGDPIITLTAGDVFNDPGATALDGCGRPLTVSVNEAVNTSQIGSYTLTYGATDAAGQSCTTTRIVNVLSADHPPVAILGGDLRLVTGMGCSARYVFDASGSYDPDGDDLSLSWSIYLIAGTERRSVKIAVPYPAGMDLYPGVYLVELTASSSMQGITLSDTDTQFVTVLRGAPALTDMRLETDPADETGFRLKISGGCFLEGATVHWNGSPRPTALVWESGLAYLIASIPAADLESEAEGSAVSVTVINGDGQTSNALSFKLLPPSVKWMDAVLSQPGESTTVRTLATDGDEPGVSIIFYNGGAEPVTVLAAVYEVSPVAATGFQVSDGTFVDLQVVGADREASAAVDFYYPSNVSEENEHELRLSYFDGEKWAPVVSSGGLPPVQNITNDLDGTLSGGRFTVVLDKTSSPSITELTGTVFGTFKSAPQLQLITGPTGPVVLGKSIEVAVQFSLLGDPSRARVRFEWDDGTETLVTPQSATTASAPHLYVEPGVYGVTVKVSDGQGDSVEGRHEYVVIYDPNGGFVTGGGWIDSPAGAYLFDAALTGRATFGFNSKYSKGKLVPSGQTQFQFQAGDFKFQSLAYEWLVVSGAKCQYRGVGRVNGEGAYGFLLTATDGQVGGGGGIDKLRIKIWDQATHEVVYDNRRGVVEDLDQAEPQAIADGSIVIQKAK